MMEEDCIDFFCLVFENHCCVKIEELQFKMTPCSTCLKIRYLTLVPIHKCVGYAHEISRKCCSTYYQMLILHINRHFQLH